MRFARKEDQLVLLVPLVVNIRNLCLDGSYATHLDLQRSSEAQGGPPHLRHLFVELQAYGDEPLAGFINNCPSLTSLELEIDLVYDEEVVRTFTCEIPLPRIVCLELSSLPDDPENPFVSVPCQCFPSVHTLTLSGQDPFPGLHSLLPTLYPLGTTLRSLTLSFNSVSDNLADNPSLPSSCDTQLIAFSSLTYLYLEGCIVSKDVGLVLLKLPQLETLGFGEGIPLSEERLEQLVIGSARLPRLERLILHLLPPPHFWKNSDPFQNTKLTFQGLDASVKKIREAGVRVDGTDLEALKIERGRVEDENKWFEIYRKVQELTIEEGAEDSEMEGEGSNRG